MSHTLEDVLSEAIRPEAQTSADWDRVVGTVRRRHRRRAAAFRATVVSFVFLGGLALFLSATGTGVDTIPAPSDLAQPVEVLESRWPSTQTIFDATTPRPTWHLVLGWFVGFGLPLLAGLGAWLAAPRHLRAEVPGQRFTRLYLGALVAFAAGLALVGVLWVPTFFLYDALAVATSQSLLFTLFAGALNGLPWIAAAAGFALAMTQSGLYSDAPASSRSGAISRVRGVFEMGWGLMGVFVVGTSITGFEGLLRWSAWEQSVATGPAGRGMWRAMLPGDRTFLNSDGYEISASGSIIALLVAALAAWLMWRYCRRSIDMALAGERLSFDVLGRLRDLPGERFLGGALLLIGLVLPLWSFSTVLTQADRLATSTAPPPAMGDVSSEVGRARNPAGSGPLVTVSYWRRGGVTEQTEMVDVSPLPIETLLPSDWVSEPCSAQAPQPEQCSDFRHVDTGDLFRVTQDFGRTQVGFSGEANRDARIGFPFLLLGGVVLALLGAALHQGRGVRYVVGPTVTALSLSMVRASLDGFSRTASVIRRAERELGVNVEDFTLEQVMTEPVFDAVADTWPSWHYPFAFTSLVLWLAAVSGGVSLIRPNRRWTAVTLTLAAALVAWATWRYFDIADVANSIVE